MGTHRTNVNIDLEKLARCQEWLGTTTIVDTIATLMDVYLDRRRAGMLEAIGALAGIEFEADKTAIHGLGVVTTNGRASAAA